MKIVVNMQFEEHTPVILKCHFLTQRGEEATISGTPTITIKHYDGSSMQTDVSAQNMTQVSGSLYYYEWAYASWQTRAYIATYNATYTDGTSVTGSETFTIVKLKTTSGGAAITGIWSEAEKDKLLKEIKNLKEGIAQLATVADVLDVIAKLKERIDEIIIRLQNNESVNKNASTEIVDRLSAIRSNLSDLTDDAEIQGKLLVAMADLTALGKVIEEVKDG